MVQWIRGTDPPGQGLLDAWCESVGRPIVTTRDPEVGDVRRLLVVSWNVHGGAARVEETVETLLRRFALLQGEVGVVLLLQEVFRTGADVPASYPRVVRVPRPIHDPPKPIDISALAERLKMTLAYVPSMRNGKTDDLSKRSDRGNAVLSTEPLSEVTAIELPFGKQRRVAVMATVTPRGARAAPLRMIALHLDTGDPRIWQGADFGFQLRRLMISGPAVVVGADLNSLGGFNDLAFRTVRASIPEEPCGTRSTHTILRRRLDFIFSTLGETFTRSCDTLDDAHGSDHRPLLLTIDF